MERVLSGERRQEEVAQQQQDVKKQLAEVDERVRAAQDILDRTIVTAPENGVVTALKQHTPGGVVQAGEAILDLVPDGDRYVIDLRINPNDIDTVYPGQPARVRLTALNARSTSPIMGAVSQISADRLIDPATGAGYFSGRVIPTDGTFGPGGPEVVAGMQAEVFLVTAERSVLDYLLAKARVPVDRTKIWTIKSRAVLAGWIGTSGAAGDSRALRAQRHRARLRRPESAAHRHCLRQSSLCLRPAVDQPRSRRR